MTKKKEQPIDEELQLLLSLVEGQDKALKIANELLTMKSRLVELCEEETALYKRENRKLHRIVFVMGVLLAINAIMSLYRLI